MRRYHDHIQRATMLLPLVIVISLLTSGCGFFLPFSAGGQPAETTGAADSTETTAGTSELDGRLAGLWTNEEQKVPVSLNSKGEPEGTVPVGEWYFFTSSGTYYRVSRYMTFAVGGVAVEEGCYTTEDGKILFYFRTESFFPDKGSPQKAKYREPVTDSSLIYRFASDNGEDILALQAGEDQPEVIFRLIP